VATWRYGLERGWFRVSAGSHATYGGWEPKTCCVCGERVTISGKNERGAIFRFNLGREPTAKHADCRPRVIVKVER
jgi:hypothetical protein